MFIIAGIYTLLSFAVCQIVVKILLQITMGNNIFVICAIYTKYTATMHTLKIQQKYR